MESNNMTSDIEEKKWYNKTWLVIVLCFFIFPIGFYALWKNTKIKKSWKIIVTVFIVFVAIVRFTTNKDMAIKPDEKSLAQADSLSSIDSLKLQIEREIKVFDKPFDNHMYKTSVETIQMELVLFSLWASIIKNGENSTDKKVNELAQILKKKVVSLQVKEFPIMRKNYGKLIAEKLWENDIYVTTQGAKNEVLNLTSVHFASNKSIAETQKAMGDIVNQFRFKKVQYRWYKNSDEITYYEIDSPKDNTIKVIEIKE